MKNADIGLIGLAVMGENLALNIESRGFSVCVYNRTKEKTENFINTRAHKKNIIPAFSLEALTSALKSPKIIMLMVKAGTPVDEYIDLLIPLLSKGDIIIDGGNSYFHDTISRTKRVEEAGLLYVGTGISGGEDGALNGPSIMPGGSTAAWKHVQPIFQAIAAKADNSVACCRWIGTDGAGHYVKMVHNGIEYCDMQLICEAYFLMKEYLGMTADEMHKVFKQWNDGVLNSYLIEITRDILSFKDDDGNALVNKILDSAGQKGTGRWTSIASFNESVPLTLVSEAVYARFLSALKDERLRASKIFSDATPDAGFAGGDNEKSEFVSDIMQALYASKIVSYAQGFVLLKAASAAYNWNLNFGDIALLWRGGCIIRSVFLTHIKSAFDKNPNLENLILDPFFTKAIIDASGAWRRVCAKALIAGIPIPAFASALTYFDGYRSAILPANLIQAQRDFFGAHTYERTDRPRGEAFHTNWTGQGGSTSSTVYTA